MKTERDGDGAILVIDGTDGEYLRQLTGALHRIIDRMPGSVAVRMPTTLPHVDLGDLTIHHAQPTIQLAVGGVPVGVQIEARDFRMTFTTDSLAWRNARNRRKRERKAGKR